MSGIWILRAALDVAFGPGSSDCIDVCPTCKSDSCEWVYISFTQDRGHLRYVTTADDLEQDLRNDPSYKGVFFSRYVFVRRRLAHV